MADVQAGPYAGWRAARVYFLAFSLFATGAASYRQVGQQAQISY